MQALNSFMAELHSGAGQFAVSNSGVLVFVPGGMFPDQVSDLYWVDRSGRAEKWAAFGSRPVEGTRLSPDGSRLAFETSGLDSGVFIYYIRRNTVARLTTGGRPLRPLWTPDGKRLVFSWFFFYSMTGPSPAEIWWATADRSATKERLIRNGLPIWASAMSPDGKYVALIELSPETGPDIRMLRMADRQVTPFAATKAAEVFPEFSPDGRWLAYVSNESERNEVYLRSFPDGKRTLQISTDGGVSPGWARDGRELFYWNIGFTRLMKVEITPGENLTAKSPLKLFEFDAAASGYIRVHDITADSQRFLLRKKKDFSLPPVTELTLVRNWLEQLKRLGPVRRSGIPLGDCPW
jgi:serine/threonine-protein kinase